METKAEPGMMSQSLLERTLVLNPYIPKMPWPKQLRFLALECRDALYGGAASGGKLLCNGTRIPTPSGFRELRELRPGDFILGRDGNPHLILAESAIVTAPAYRLTFDDGAQIDAHDDHLWLTFSEKEMNQLTRLDPEWRARRRAKRPSRSRIGAGQRWRHTEDHRRFLSRTTTERNRRTAQPKAPMPTGTVRTTAEIVATLQTHRGRPNHAIPVAEPVELPEKSLPLDPYVLGLWLGDGTSCSGHITTADAEIVAAVVAAGFPVRSVSQQENNKAATYGHDGLYPILKGMGLVRNKSVPHDYLWASKGQRLALLQGLLDTDGWVEGRCACFTNTRKHLTEAVAHLARSLGHKVRVREGVARLNGEIVGPVWRVKFAAKMQVFRLRAKADKLKLSTDRRTRFRRIVGAERIDPIEMKCLKVSAPDRLFLVGEHFIPTHNSEALLMGALQFAEVPGYAALIVRRNFTDLKLPGGLIDRSIEWLGKNRAAHWNAQEHRWRFRSGATLQFGYADKEGDERRYDGTEFQFCGIDESCQFTETQLLFFFERLRRKAEIPVPIRMRLATTPGGVGHSFIKARYVKPGTPGKAFVPATVFDNPAVDTEEYVQTLGELKTANPLRYRQMLEGDWDAVEGGRFKREWFGSYRTDPALRDTVILTAGTAHGGAEVERIVPDRCGCFQTCDPAASASKDADFFVVSTWLVTPRANVVWWGCHQGRYEIPEQVSHCQRLYRAYRPQFVGVEEVLNQRALAQILRRSTNPVMAVRGVTPRGQNKADHAAGFISLSASGRVFLPEPGQWRTGTFPLEEVVDELLRFTGEPKKDAHDDVVDTGSYMVDVLPFVRPGSGGGRAAPVRHESKAADPYSGLR